MIAWSVAALFICPGCSSWRARSVRLPGKKTGLADDAHQDVEESFRNILYEMGKVKTICELQHVLGKFVPPLYRKRRLAVIGYCMWYASSRILTARSGISRTLPEVVLQKLGFIIIDQDAILLCSGPSLSGLVFSHHICTSKSFRWVQNEICLRPFVVDSYQQVNSPGVSMYFNSFWQSHSRLCSAWVFRSHLLAFMAGQMKKLQFQEQMNVCLLKMGGNFDVRWVFSSLSLEEAAWAMAVVNVISPMIGMMLLQTFKMISNCCCVKVP